MTAPTSLVRPDAVSAALGRATRVADVMLLEGYVLYPYRASARKNQMRWQFGVLVPPAYGADSGEHPASRTECLVEPRGAATVHVQVRFLQVQGRAVEERTADGFSPVPVLRLEDRDLVPWDEGVVCLEDVDVALAPLLEGLVEHRFTVPGGTTTEDVERDGNVVGRLVRRREELRARLLLSAERLDGPYGAVRLRAVLHNDSPWEPPPGAVRADALRHALVAAHLLVGLGDASFLSLLDPPEWAAPAAAGCVNEHTWPVLVGDGDRHDVVLSSPIILYDHPEIAPESPGELYDATEIDEILSLRTLSLTEEEKREARGTDARAAAVVDRVDTMPPEVLDRLHGTIRSLHEVGHEVGTEDASVVIGGVRVARGSRLRLRPRPHGSDAQDIFLVGKAATVEEVLADVDGGTHIAVTLDDDPGADLQRAEGRFLYFRPDEVEPRTSRTLVAGIGNVFLSDDAFGVEVARRLAERGRRGELPPDVEVADVGIRGVHLAYQLMDGYDALVLVDAMPRGGPPGTVYVLEPDLSGAGLDPDDDSPGPVDLPDAHSMDPGTVLALLAAVNGGTVPVGRVHVVGCEPATVEEGMSLSPEVRDAVGRGVEAVLELVADRPVMTRGGR